MAKKPEAAARTQVPEQQGRFPLTLEEWCARTSTTDRRVEMLGAFYAAERAAGRFKDTEEAFAARLAAFAGAPA